MTKTLPTTIQRPSKRPVPSTVRYFVSALTLFLASHAALAEPLPLSRGGVWAPDGRRTLEWGSADPWLAALAAPAVIGAGLAWPEPRFDFLVPREDFQEGERIDDLGPFFVTAGPSASWKLWGDAWLWGTAGGALAIFVPYEIGGGSGSTARYFARAGILWEAWAATLGTTVLMKKAVGRIRPYAREDPDVFLNGSNSGGGVFSNPGDDDFPAGESGTVIVDIDAEHSFPSGHASMVAVGTFGFTTMCLLSQRELEPVQLLWYLVPTAISGTVAYSRVRANAHYPTDVAAGMAIGAAAGVLVPLAHYRRHEPLRDASSVALDLLPGGQGIILSGVF
jgi:membrane-associated phospholipid phosphatase